MTRLVVTTVAVAFLTGAIGFATGVRLAGEDAPSASSVDVRFLIDMTAHHEQAIQLSILELRHGGDPAIQTFAREILYQQGYEIGAMENSSPTGVSAARAPGCTRWRGWPATTRWTRWATPGAVTPTRCSCA